MPRTIPRPEDLHVPYGELKARTADLQSRQAQLSAESRSLQLQRMESPGFKRWQERIDAIVTGTDYVEPPPVEARLSEVNRELRDLKDAESELGSRLRDAHSAASRKVCLTVQQEHRALARRIFESFAAAATARAEMDELFREIGRVGADVVGLPRTANDIFDGSIRPASDFVMDLRKAVREGYLDEKKLPKAALNA